jgi:hypothetical protein
VYSLDGVSWTATPDSPFSSSINGIAYGGGTFWAVESSGRMAYSSDGVSWTVFAGRPFSDGSGIAYGNGTFVAVGDRIVYSSANEPWTLVSSSPFSPIVGIIYGSKFIAMGSNGKLASSPNGKTWSEAITPTVPSIDSFTTDSYGIAYGGDKFVAFVNNDRIVWSLRGEESWEEVIDNPFRTSIIYGIAYGGGKFVAVGDGGKTAYSSDGKTWVEVPSRTSGNIAYSSIKAMVYGGGRFVMVGNNGQIAYSNPQ